ncbi:MAG TPA: hypothetical protein VMB53_11235 [Gaiellaceae bacterium]|nr:hypothetical protein [Gaiellaceae bacterium]
MKKSALALAAVLVLAVTVFVSTGSATNVRPHPFVSTGFSSGPDQDVRSTPKQDVRSTPDQDVRSRTPDQDVRGRVAPHAAKTWASKAWGSSWS